MNRPRRPWIHRHRFSFYAAAAIVGLLGAAAWLKRDSLHEVPAQLYLAVLGAPQASDGASAPVLEPAQVAENKD